MLPVVGVPLPFVSYGGTAMATLGLALGILMSIARAQRMPVAQAHPVDVTGFPVVEAPTPPATIGPRP